MGFSKSHKPTTMSSLKAVTLSLSEELIAELDRARIKAFSL
jgi:hypothetical protein